MQTRSIKVVVKCCCQGCSKEIIDELVNKHDINKKKEQFHCCKCEYEKMKKKKKKTHCCKCEDEEEEEEKSHCCKCGNETKRPSKPSKHESTHRIEPYVPPVVDKRVCRDIFCTDHYKRSIIRPSVINNPVPMMPPPFMPYYHQQTPMPFKLPPSPLFFRHYMMPPPHPSHTWEGSRRC